MRQSPSLIRARRPYLVKNALIGVGLFALTGGICTSPPTSLWCPKAVDFAVCVASRMVILCVPWGKISKLTMRPRHARCHDVAKDRSRRLRRRQGSRRTGEKRTGSGATGNEIACPGGWCMHTATANRPAPGEGPHHRGFDNAVQVCRETKRDGEGQLLSACRYYPMTPVSRNRR